MRDKLIKAPIKIDIKHLKRNSSEKPEETISINLSIIEQLTKELNSYNKFTSKLLASNINI